MLEYDKIDVSNKIDVNKTNESCRCIICNYDYYKVNVRFQQKGSGGYHDLMQKAISFKVLILLKDMILEFIFGTWVEMKPQI